VQPHPLLHERVSPHVILQDGAQEIAIAFTDNPAARAMLPMKECYADRAELYSAFWRPCAIGPLLEQPRWLLSSGAEGRNDAL
jgi:hypothetical protein